MWAHYAENHKGIVIGLDTSLLPKFGLPLQPINYVHKYPTKNLKHSVSTYMGRTNNVCGEQWLQEQFFTKSKEWSYEKEWRLVAPGSIKNSNYLYEFDSAAIKEIYFGCEVEPEIQDKLISLVLLINKNIRIFESSISDRSFELVFNQIQLSGSKITK